MNVKACGILFHRWLSVGRASMIAFKAVAGEASAPALVPLPVRLEFRAGVFKLRTRTRILVDAEARETGRYLAERLGPATGCSFRFGADTERARGNIVLTTRGANAALGAEGYELVVTQDSVVIRAPGPAGLFYGVQSLLELLPPKILAAKPAGSGDWTMPCVRIEDQPRFKWRGLLLDVSRHFFTKERGQATPGFNGAAQIESPPIAPDGRPGLAHRDQEVSTPDGSRRLAQGHRLRP